LTFQSSIIQDGREKGTYDIDKGFMSFNIPKANPGEIFQDLDLLTQLLSSNKTSSLEKVVSIVKETKAKSGPSMIEEVADEGEGALDDSTNEDDEELGDWNHPQTLPEAQVSNT
jgi:protein SHQ1